MALVGLFSVEPGTSPPRAVSPTRTHDPKSTAHERDQATLATKTADSNHHNPAERNRHDPAERNRHDPAELNRHDPAERNRHDPAECTLDCPTLVQTTTLLLIRWEGLFSPHLPPDWTRGCRMTRGHLPIGCGVRVMLALRSLAGGNGPCPSLGRSLDLRRWRLRPCLQPKTRGPWRPVECGTVALL